MPMDLRSHRTPCIFWPPIFYYFFAFYLIILPFAGCYPATLGSCIPSLHSSSNIAVMLLLGNFCMALFSTKIVISLVGLVYFFLISFKSLLKCHFLNEAFSKLPHIQPSSWNSFSLALFIFFPYITICYRKISF